MSETSTPQLTDFNSFSDMVAYSQNQWKVLKKAPLSTFSQHAEIPGFVQNEAFRIIMNHLPSYIPVDVKKNLTETHRPPLITAGVLIDQRANSSELGINSSINVPETVVKKDIKAWFYGMTLLNEIATETLTVDIISSIANSKSKNPVIQWMAPVARMENIFKSKQAIGNADKNLKGLLKGEQSYENFKRSLVIANLTGSKEYVRYNLDDLAIKIGSRDRYGGLEMKLVESVENDNLRRFLESIMIGGLTFRKSPGIINLNLAPYSIPTISAGVAALSLTVSESLLKSGNLPSAACEFILGLWNFKNYAQSAFRLPHVLVHETSHYLGSGLKHSGLFNLK